MPKFNHTQPKIGDDYVKRTPGSFEVHGTCIGLRIRRNDKGEVLSWEANVYDGFQGVTPISSRETWKQHDYHSVADDVRVKREELIEAEALIKARREQEDRDLAAARAEVASQDGAPASAPEGSTPAQAEDDPFADPVKAPAPPAAKSTPKAAPKGA